VPAPTAEIEVAAMYPPDVRVPRFARVRPVFWALLSASVLLTLLVPALVLWRASAMPLAARACLWPAVPHYESPAYVVVTLANPRDRTAMHGPWAQLMVNWDMTTMPMGTRSQVVNGASHNGAVPSGANDTHRYAIPLQLTMVGPWWARISLQTPGRPTWSSLLRFTVGPPGGASAGPPSPPVNTCASSTAT
jgi:hypothetical protein